MIDRKGKFWQGSSYLSRQCVLTMAGIKGEVDFATKVCLVGHTRLKSVTQLVGSGLCVIFVEVGTNDVHVSREVSPRMGLGVLLVGPMDFKVCTLLIIGSAFCAYLVDSETQSHRSVESVAFVVAESRLDAPGSARVDVAQNLQVIIGSLMLFALSGFGIKLNPVPDAVSWLNVLGLAVLPTAVATITLAAATKAVGATKTSVLGILEPLTAIVIGTLVFKEAFTINVAFGVALILFAILFMILSEKKP